jgi:hypothetical protein
MRRPQNNVVQGQSGPGRTHSFLFLLKADLAFQEQNWESEYDPSPEES